MCFNFCTLVIPFRCMVMYSRTLHLKVSGSSVAVLTCFDCDQAMKDQEFSEKGKKMMPLRRNAHVIEMSCVEDFKNVNYMKEEEKNKLSSQEKKCYESMALEGLCTFSPSRITVLL